MSGGIPPPSVSPHIHTTGLWQRRSGQVLKPYQQHLLLSTRWPAWMKPIPSVVYNFHPGCCVAHLAGDVKQQHREFTTASSAVGTMAAMVVAAVHGIPDCMAHVKLSTNGSHSHGPHSQQQYCCSMQCCTHQHACGRSRT